VPGELGFWVFIFGELFMFASFFLVFAYMRTRDPAAFHTGQGTLSMPIGIANTFLLLTGSMFVVLGVQAARANRGRAVAVLVLLAVTCGLCFVLNKVYEYTTSVRAGHFPDGNEFYGYYYVLTGLHLFHVAVSMIALAAVGWRIRRRPNAHRDQQALENAAVFWHLVDLIWIVLFSLLYLSN